MRRTIWALAAALALAGCGGADDAAEAPANRFLKADSAAPAPAAADYVGLAAAGDQYEIQAARLALDKSDSAEVRGLAQMIRADHQRSTARLAEDAADAGSPIASPPSLSREQEADLARLRAAATAAFDREYLGRQVRAHEQALRLAFAYARGGDRPALRRHAASTIAPIQTHLIRARRLEAEARARR